MSAIASSIVLPGSIAYKIGSVDLPRLTDTLHVGANVLTRYAVALAGRFKVFVSGGRGQLRPYFEEKVPARRSP